MKFSGTSRAEKQQPGEQAGIIPPYNSRYALANLSPRGYISPSANIYHHLRNLRVRLDGCPDKVKRKLCSGMIFGAGKLVKKFIVELIRIIRRTA